VDVDTLDNILAGVRPTIIKIDIEGLELDALKGGKHVIFNSRPILAVALYHKPNDIWQIPAYIHFLAPEYKIYLRRYAEECWEEVMYAIPKERAK
jgi:hypothetical protein